MIQLRAPEISFCLDSFGGQPVIKMKAGQEEFLLVITRAGQATCAIISSLEDENVEAVAGMGFAYRESLGERTLVASPFGTIGTYVRPRDFERARELLKFWTE